MKLRSHFILQAFTYLPFADEMLVSWYLKNKISLVIFPVWKFWGMTWWFWLPLKSRKRKIHDVVEPGNNKSGLKNGREGWKHCRIQIEETRRLLPKEIHFRFPVELDTLPFAMWVLGCQGWTVGFHARAHKMRFVIPCRQVVWLLHTDFRLAAGLWAQQHATAAPGPRLTLTAWDGDSFGRLERRKMAAPVMSPCSLLLHHFTCPPFITWIKSRFHKAHFYETRLGNKVNYSVVKGNTMMGENVYFWKSRSRGLSVNFFPWRKFTTILLQSFLKWGKNHNLNLLCTNNTPFLAVNVPWFQCYIHWRASILEGKMQPYCHNKGHQSSVLLPPFYLWGCKSAIWETSEEVRSRLMSAEWKLLLILGWVPHPDIALMSLIGKIGSTSLLVWFYVCLCCCSIACVSLSLWD